MGYNLFFCPPCEWQASVYSTKPLPPGIHVIEVCCTHVLGLHPPSCRLRYNPSPPFPPFLPQSGHILHHFKCILPLVASLGRPQFSSFARRRCCASWASSGEVSDTSSSSALPEAEREERGGRVGGSALYPAVSLCLCASAASHQLQPDIRRGCSSWHSTA